MRTSFFIAFVLMPFLMLSIAIAVPFTATSTPTSLNAGQSTQLINFTIQNIGSVNITQVNITLPAGFTFTGTSGATTTSPYTASATIPYWINASSVGIVGNGATQYFWAYVNTARTTVSYGFNVSTLDANAVFNSSNVTLTIFDDIAPTYSSNTTSPSTNGTYSPNQTYWFNITWSDGSDISKVLLEHNITGSGTPHNDTMSNSSSVYYLSTTDMAVGTYVWRVYANDTNNTFNSTPQFTYVIRQASNELKIYLNGTLNSNITSVNNTAVNVTVNASCSQPACTITILRDNSTNIISGGSNPYSKNDTITAVGLHNYTISVAGNANYTSNSSTFYVATVPSYTISTFNMPLSYSNTTVESINITFDGNSDMASAQIEGDWTGTATNYTISNFSLTRYYYNIIFPGGRTTWKLYGVYSNHTFNITPPTSFTINEATPTIRLNITPDWTLETAVQTNVSCVIETGGLTLKLYRNSTEVTNPDVQTFAAGSIYAYLCNNTANRNYTVNTAKNTLMIKPRPTANLSFVQAPAMIEAVQNTTTSSEIKVKNTGSAAQYITLSLSGLDASWYSIDKTTTNILGGTTTTFIITFNIGNVDVKDHPAKFNVNGTNGTISQDFTLRVLPSTETKLKINDTIALYKLDVNKLESKFEGIKAKINNTAAIEQKLGELKSSVKKTEDYINSNDYFQAQQTFETIKALIAEVDNQLKAAETAGIKVEIPSNVWLVIIAAVFVVIIGAVTYLFWPVKKGYKAETGEYVYGAAGKKTLLDNIKNLLSKLKRKKKQETVLTES